MFIINFCLNMFRVLLYPFSGEQRPCYCIWCVALVLLDVVGSGCGALRCRMRAVLDMFKEWRIKASQKYYAKQMLSERVREVQIESGRKWQTKTVRILNLSNWKPISLN
jgi:hypothetical protein